VIWQKFSKNINKIRKNSFGTVCAKDCASPTSIKRELPMLNFANRSLAGTFALVATMLTLAAATPLRAEAPSVKVAYGDLNLGTQAGVDALDSRIHHAARKVCADNSGDRMAVAQCRSTALKSARSQVAVAVKAEGTRLALR
jgi:UrcA family protein